MKKGMKNVVWAVVGCTCAVCAGLVGTHGIRVNGRMRGNEERELAAIYLLGETGMLKSYFHMILPNEDRDYIRNAIAAMREYGNL